MGLKIKILRRNAIHREMRVVPVQGFLDRLTVIFHCQEDLKSTYRRFKSVFRRCLKILISLQFIFQMRRILWVGHFNRSHISHSCQFRLAFKAPMVNGRFFLASHARSSVLPLPRSCAEDGVEACLAHVVLGRGYIEIGIVLVRSTAPDTK